MRAGTKRVPVVDKIADEQIADFEHRARNFANLVVLEAATKRRSFITLQAYYKFLEFLEEPEIKELRGK